MLRRRRSEDAPKPRRRIRKLRLLVLLVILLLLASTAFTFGLVTAIAGEIPTLDPRYQEKLEKDGYIYDRTGKTVLAVLRGRESRAIVDADRISPWMKHAIIAIEDKRFLEHSGVDLRGIARAAWEDVTNKAVVQGGSTITQQFVKNALIDEDRTISRKVKEAAIARQLELDWSKDEILTAYLNTIYFGNGAYGVQQAALTYFGHGASQLTLPEAALLAGIPRDPSRYDPVANGRQARLRRNLVLRMLFEQGTISRRAFLAATATPLPKAEDVRPPGIQGRAPYFANYVKQQLVDTYGTSKVFGQGYRVITSIDLDVQKLARKAIAKWLNDPKGPSAALVAIDPRDGSVLAMVGGNNYRKSEFNLAVQAERQPGSSFKPFVLASALQKGVAPVSTFVSKPLLVSLGDKFWSVHNYEDAYLGAVTLDTATVHSDNTVYAQVTQLVGPKSVVKIAHRLGIRSQLDNYFAIGLGAEAVNPLEMARSFSAFASGGYRVDGSIFGNEPRAVLSVQKPETKRPTDNRVVPRRMLRRSTALTVNSILQRVVSQGTGRRAALVDRPAAGKTGTTENYGDAWFVGYTPQLVAAVWVGYPNTLRPMLTEYHGEAVAGGTFPALIWKTFMESALAYRHDEPATFDPPPFLSGTSKRVVRRDGRLLLDNGLCRGAQSVVYFSGFGPTETARCKPNEVEVPHVVGQTIENAQARLAAQPLTPVVAYQPAKPLQRIDRVIAQSPARGRLSSYDNVTLFLPKPLHGVIPKVVGLSLRAAKVKLHRLRVQVDVAGFTDGPVGRVVAQAPAAGVAAAPDMTVSLVVGRG
ncbi:MAG TPA: PBP1A family penicillin-binding protein [Gaiellaceae bacterium]|nr:PBP1A family penicillin-binding protein [Gaiellaceae bacterium]